jgi:hypothetical protein
VAHQDEETDPMSNAPRRSARRVRRARRLALLAVVAAAGFIAAGGLAGAASPTPGYWNSKNARFTVNAKMTRITEFTSKCTGYPFRLKMKIKADGSFSHKVRKSLEGGKAATEKVRGKFTSATTAKVTASYGRCKEKFTATTKVAPVETTPTVTTETDPGAR